MEQPFLQFQFKLASSPITFCDPVEILTTTNISEVKTIFGKVEQALTDGYYVAGYVSYEAAPAFDGSYQVKQSDQFPLVWFGVFRQPTHLSSDREMAEYHITSWKNTTTKENYQSKIEQIKQAIAAGNTYQVNYTTKLQAQFSGDSYAFYQQLLQNQQAAYGAYLNIGDYHILSASPELFFKTNNGKVITKPMKGTMARGTTVVEDNELKEKLYHSEKERAENVMIVDLLRNDLGRIAKLGSVQVKNLFNIETYPTLHQMTSTIEAELKRHTTVFDWFQALFPCGSITGAPKVETMKYIARLENTPRDVYCGAIGWIDPNRNAIFNVPIRTVVIDSHTQQASYGAGGGVTWDSTSESEYEELMQKAAFLDKKQPSFALLESMLLENGSYPLLEGHMKRLNSSATYFQYPFHKQQIEKELKAISDQNTTGSWKVRLQLDKNEGIVMNKTRVNQLTEPVVAVLATEPITQHDPFVYHKTTNRHQINRLDQIKSDEVFTTLLWNQNGYITEFAIGNIVLEKNGQFYTPPIEDGLLPGILRGELITQNKVKVQSILMKEIPDYDSIWFINSVRGWLKVELI